MGKIQKNSITQNIQKYIPITLLFISVLNEFDFNNLGLIYFSFNFSYILIFYYGLKRSESLGYIYIFIAGLFNDVVVGTPIGISSLMFLILSGAAAYLRNITLRPSLIKDSIFFLITILVINSLLFMYLNFTFNYELNYSEQISNIICTYLLYFLFANLFNFFETNILGNRHVG
jgi:rod shape-determining protein MreD